MFRGWPMTLGNDRGSHSPRSTRASSANIKSHHLLRPVEGQPVQLQADPEPRIVESKESVRKEERIGNLDCLAKILACVEVRRKLFEGDSDTKSKGPTLDLANVKSLTDEELTTLLTLLAKATGDETK